MHTFCNVHHFPRALVHRHLALERAALRLAAVIPFRFRPVARALHALLAGYRETVESLAPDRKARTSGVGYKHGQMTVNHT
ncbi:MAG: hypothetical protein NZM11_07075 [Anaerolineales bacterium]|nr:hypothetical protein [Anaerolineales bacterium]